MARVGVIGIGHGRFGRRSDATVQELAFEAFRMALEDAGIERDELDASVIAAVPEYHKQRSVAGHPSTCESDLHCYWHSWG